MFVRSSGFSLSLFYLDILVQTVLRPCSGQVGNCRLHIDLLSGFNVTCSILMQPAF